MSSHWKSRTKLFKIQILRSTLGSIEFPTPTTPAEEECKLPADRVLDLMQLGFSFDEIKQVSGREVMIKFDSNQITEMFDQYKELMKPQSPSLSQVLNQFSNFISTSVPEHLKLISSAFNLLEMGYSRRDILKSILREVRWYSYGNSEISEAARVRRLRSTL